MQIPSNSILFASDVHLSEQTPALTALFMRFLQGPARQATALYLLGDLFDAWVGEDLLPSFHHELLSAIHTLTRHHIPVFFIPGNRDFLMTHSYLKKIGMIGLPERTIITLHKTPTLLMHGDLLCTQDKFYQRYRKVAQHPWTRFSFLKLPYSLRKKIALTLRQKSKRYQQQQSLEILDVTPKTVIANMQQAKVLQMIHGHVHRPAIHTLQVNEQPAKRFVLGDWQETRGSVIVASPEETILTTFE